MIREFSQRNIGMTFLISSLVFIMDVLLFKNVPFIFLLVLQGSPADYHIYFGLRSFQS